MKVTITALGLLICLISGAVAQDCPDFTHWDVIEGDKTTLPEGWFAYAHQPNGYVESLQNIFKSPIHEYNPVPLLDEPEIVIMLDVSEDGKWIVFVAQYWYNTQFTNDQGQLDSAGTAYYESYLIKNDGTGKTKIPFIDCKLAGDNPQAGKFGHPTTAGFIKGGPYGTEIFYINQPNQMSGIRVDLSGDTPVFGENRKIVDFSGSNFIFCAGGGGEETWVCKNHII